MTAVEAVLLDLDGTVIHGDSLLPGAAEGVRAIRGVGLDVLFLTNNPTRSPEAWAEQLSDLGLSVDASEVLTSAAATVRYLDDHHAGERMLPIAGPAVVEQLREADLAFVDDSEAADVVVAGYHEGFEYGDLRRGLRALLAGAALVGTDPDRWVPAEEGPIPGSGAIVNALAGAAEVEPDAVLGKPSQVTIGLATARLGTPAESCLLVGDRLATDVAMGERAGMTTALVLTGAFAREDLRGSEIRPDHVLDSLGELAELLGRE